MAIVAGIRCAGAINVGIGLSGYLAVPREEKSGCNGVYGALNNDLSRAVLLE